MKKENVEYLYNFVGGGWNSEFATSKAKAYKQAIERWKGSKTLIVDKESFRASTESDYFNLMSNFY